MMTKKCSICLKSIFRDRCKLIDCKHTFHRQCIERSRRETSMKCPNCGQVGLTDVDHSRIVGGTKAKNVVRYIESQLIAITDANRREDYATAVLEAIVSSSSGRWLDDVVACVERRVGSFPKVVKSLVCRALTAPASTAVVIERLTRLRSFNWHMTVDGGLSLYEFAIRNRAGDDIVRFVRERSSERLYPTLKDE